MEESHSICLEETLPYPAHIVWSALTRPDQLKAWFRFGHGDRLLRAWTDPRPGGQYHLRYLESNGTQVDYRGIYREVSVDRRLCMGWPAYGRSELETGLEFDLAPDGRGTLLVLLHDDLRDRKMARDTRRGWEVALASLKNELPGIQRRH